MKLQITNYEIYSLGDTQTNQHQLNTDMHQKSVSRTISTYK